MSKQVKSKQRVADHGEVFTAEREVESMLDLVKAETERIDSRFLEPACGDGNFLAKVLERKLNVVKKQYKKLASDYEKYSILFEFPHFFKHSYKMNVCIGKFAYL